ncbi:VOC family protein [Paralcaligenes sp. KSB-10]|jgi:catechol 2,3-dioxygenase-like lactoylglutathione lyase family enzyme|uniref:VOC family protein n=1 Tax=Paralcaligenes sp. KSB-10 TaxID=2901142 RepID=UPI001E517CC2|nr:VOC family protein [Paralcaligenes sp. KSB-10]UHL64314.1 VOC family protein [Paralcaligenes sp. KSB-10]
MFKIQHIDHIVLRVSNLQAMLSFYLNALGCSMDRIRDDLGLYQIRAGNSLIDLITIDGILGREGGAAPGREARNLDHFCLSIAPFDAKAIQAHLRRHDVQVGDPVSRYGAQGEGPSLYINDPDGNLVELKGPAWEMAAPQEM